MRSTTSSEVELAHRLGQLLGRKEGDHLLAQAFVKVRQHVSVDDIGREEQHLAPLSGIDLLEEVGDVSRMQRLEKRVETLRIRRWQPRAAPPRRDAR